MTPEEIPQSAGLESTDGGLSIPYHVHNGIDSPKVRFSDILNVFYKSVTYDPGNLVDGAGETGAFVFAEAAFGDFVLASAPYDLVGITVTAYVSSAGNIAIRVQNESGLTVNLASGTWKLMLIKNMF